MMDAFILSRDALLDWVTELAVQLDVFGPVLKKKGQTIFEKITDSRNLNLDYRSTMTSPRCFIYPSWQSLFQIDRRTGGHKTITTINNRAVILAIHPCDMHAISVLDRTFLGDFKDACYQRLRRDAVTVVLNCNQACEQGFCASMGTGPFLQLQEGFDIVLTARSDDYLMEFGSEAGRKLAAKISRLQPAHKKDLTDKKKIEKQAIDSFKKTLDTTGLVEVLMQNLDHPVYKQVADARCLGCTNCTMVCPTCYCYNVQDYTGIDLKTTERRRHWDSCQELNFARVHGGNFRSSRQARLRQFVTHKLATWVQQYGCFGCVGCGRCMTWCPTGIDLTEIAKQIQKDVAGVKAG